MKLGPRSLNVVLLAYHYPPDPAVGSLRPAKVALALRDAGHDVTVITAQYGKETAGVRADEPGLRVLAVNPFRNPREWYVERKQRKRHAAAGTPAPPLRAGAWVKPLHTPFWKRMVFSLLWLPDDRQGFIIPALRAARPLLRRPNSIVYVTAPPFSSFLAGWWLHRSSGVPWIAEFRDPWAGNPWKPAHVRTGFTEGMEQWMEQRVLRTARLVVAVSDGIERGLRPKMANSNTRLVVIRNGIDELLSMPVATRAAGPLRIVHVGSFYHARDPGPFLRALAEFRQRKQLGPGDIRVDLVGKCRWFRGESVEDKVSALGLADLVHFHDWVPHDEARAFVHSADVLLLLAQSQPNQVPNKLYEYLGARRTILAFVDEEGESASMLRSVGGHYLVTEGDSVAAEAALAQITGRTTPASLPSEEVLRSWASEAQMRQLTERIEEIQHGDG